MPRYNSLFERLVVNSHKPDDQNENGCWLWTGTTDVQAQLALHGKVSVRIDGKHTSLRAHRAMAQLFEDRPLDPEHETVEHLCGNGLREPRPLELIDRVDNSLRSIMENRRGIWNGR